MPVKVSNVADGVETAAGYEWLCGSCEILRAKPWARRAVPLPSERPPLPLQRDRLFELP